jgi:hypothetical protein
VRFLLAIAVAVAVVAPAGAPASGLHRCPDNAPFSVAIYVKGMPCHDSLLVISTWRTAQHRRCHTHAACEFTYHSPSDREVRFHLKCSNTHMVDHRNRHYIYMACVSDDRNHDIRAHYYPRGDYRPDR